MIALSFREILPENVLTELDLLVASINALWLLEHNDDGTHGDITSDSVSITSADWWIRMFTPNFPEGNNLLFQFAQDQIDDLSYVPVIQSFATKMIIRFANGFDTVSDIIVGGVAFGGETNAGLLFKTSQTDSNAVDWGIALFSDGVTTRDSMSVVDQSYDSGNGYRVMSIYRGNPLLPNPNDDYAVVPGQIGPEDVYLGVRGDSSHRWTEVAGTMLYGSLGVEERDRTTPMGEWESYTPEWTSTGTQPAIVNGTIIGRYTLIGTTMHFFIKVTMGSSTTYGTGTYRLSLPLAVLTTNDQVGFARYNNTGIGAFLGAWFLDTSTRITLRTNASPVAVVTALAPFTFGDTDIIFAMGTLELEPA